MNESTWAIVVVAALTAVAPTIAALAAWRASKRTHRAFNSRMTELLQLARDEAYARGVIDTKAAQGDARPP